MRVYEYRYIRVALRPVQPLVQCTWYGPIQVNANIPAQAERRKKDRTSSRTIRLFKTFMVVCLCAARWGTCNLSSGVFFVKHDKPPGAEQQQHQFLRVQKRLYLSSSTALPALGPSHNEGYFDGLPTDHSRSTDHTSVLPCIIVPVTADTPMSSTRACVPHQPLSPTTWPAISPILNTGTVGFCRIVFGHTQRTPTRACTIVTGSSFKSKRY